MVKFVQKDFYNIDDLIKIVSTLRGKGGCPWDIEQTHESIKSDFVEEVWEALEAIDLNDSALLREELGDVLLQVVFHSQIETEMDNFNFSDVCDEICKKLIVRHPHVFGDTIVNDTDDVLKNWDNIKKITKEQDTYTDTLTSVAKSLPALMRAQKVGKRAMRAGMDFKCKEDAIDCVVSEKIEFDEAVALGDADKIFDEFGDLLFSCVNVARHLNINAEDALNHATEKFINRFAQTEKLVELDGSDMKELTIDDLDVYWKRAKNIL